MSDQYEEASPSIMKWVIIGLAVLIVVVGVSVTVVWYRGRQVTAPVSGNTDIPSTTTPPVVGTTPATGGSPRTVDPVLQKMNDEAVAELAAENIKNTELNIARTMTDAEKKREGIEYPGKVIYWYVPGPDKNSPPVRRVSYVGEVDTDKDKLPDWVEKQIGTNPNNPDTDGDGWFDAAEQLYGTNPLVADKHDPSVKVPVTPVKTVK